jgi:GlpG protein
VLLFRRIAGVPLTAGLIVLCTLLWLIAPLERPTALTFALRFPDFSNGTGTIVLAQVVASFGLAELGKMLSPMLLHGGLLHLVFNMMWVWELGERIESIQRTLQLLLAILLISLCSNTVQFLWGGGINFGGMSGVVYGLFAYIWMWQVVDPAKGLALPRATIVFMLVLLALFTWLDLPMIANAGHTGGFVAGIGYGLVRAGLSRWQRPVAELPP